MNFKDFVDISTIAGCKVGSKKDFRTNRIYYTIEYDGKVYAKAIWSEEDQKIIVEFRDTYLKWYQSWPYTNYGWVEKKTDYEKKLAKVINQNKEK